MAGLADLNNRKILFMGGGLFVAIVALIIFVNIWVRSSLQEMQNQATSAPPAVTAQQVEVEMKVAPALRPAANAPQEVPAAEKNSEAVPIEREAPITTKILNE